jgi:2,5-dihydroxypyridine 5,6-dioxygenase
MDWNIAYPHYMPAPSSFVEMMRGAFKAMDCAAVKPGENVVILADTNKIRVAEALAGASVAVGAIPTIIINTPSGMHGRQPPTPAIAACARSDVFFLPTSFSTTHTDARIQAIHNGARGCTMCDVTEDTLSTGGILADYEECDRLGRKLGELMAQSKEIRVRSARGTDIRGQIAGRPVQYETGLFRNPGDLASLPNSEINISPIEGTTEGRVVADVRIMSVGVTRQEPVTIIVKDGLVRDIQGGAMAERLAEILADLKDETAYNLAEFGIGLNPVARRYSSNQEDLGTLGNVHHGIGSNYAIGGKVKAPCHIDATYRDAIIEFDGRVVMECGKPLV